MIEFTASVVTYNNNREQIQKLIRILLNISPCAGLFVIDHSPNDDLRRICLHPRVIYIHNAENPGFGAGHNLAINSSIQDGYQYHFIVNPDIYFDSDVLTPMVNYMNDHADVGMMMPEILNVDGSVQYLPKLLPNPIWILKRKLKSTFSNFNNFINNYEMRTIPRHQIYNTPILSGCFTLLNLAVIREVGAYDRRYFMYFEDFDLSRRIHRNYKTLYFPQVSVYHGYEGGANRSCRLFSIFILSAIAYFNKWGWILDNERKRMNKKAIKQR